MPAIGNSFGFHFHLFPVSLQNLPSQCLSLCFVIRKFHPNTSDTYRRISSQRSETRQKEEKKYPSMFFLSSKKIIQEYPTTLTERFHHKDRKYSTERGENPHQCLFYNRIKFSSTISGDTDRTRRKST